MIDIPQGIPSQIIDLAEKNVEQARGAFLGFIGAAQKATDAAESLPPAPRMRWPRPCHLQKTT